jgi:branched-chain amino acid transport system permease protein
MTFEVIAQSIIFGIMLGAIYGLAALGFSFVFGVMKVLNIAHGSLLMLGGYAAFFIFSFSHIDPFLSLPLVAAILFLIGLAAYKGVFSSMLRLHEELKIKNTLLIAFGLILILDQAAVLLFTADDRGITPAYAGAGFEMFGLQFTYIRLAGLVVAGVIIFALQLFLNNTYFGKSIRATAEDWEAATLMGINIDRTYLVSFALGAALAGMAGMVVVTIYSITPHIGLEWTLKALIVMVLAGMGNISGVFIAGILLGVAESISAIFVGPYSVVVGLVLFLLVLMFRPQGLFGKK